MSNYLLSVPEAVQAYNELSVRVRTMLESLTDSEADLVVPHCPQWSVKDTLAHMVGVIEDALNNNMEGVTTDKWTQAQVERHRSHSIPEVLAQWAEISEAFGSVLMHIPQPRISLFVFDQVTHEHDLRFAIGKCGEHDSMAVLVADGFFRDSLAQEEDERISGMAESELDAFNLLRSVTGRRSRNQIAQCGLDPNLVEMFLVDSPFSIPAFDLDETA